VELSEEMDVDNSRNTPIPFNEKWGKYKTLLERLYLDEKLQLPKIKKIMWEEHNFDAE
jgi:hypothetical protein